VELRAILLLPAYAFMGCTRNTILLTLTFITRELGSKVAVIPFSSCIIPVMLVAVRSTRRKAKAAGLLGSRGRASQSTWLLCFVVSCVGSGLCVELITRSGESCRVSECVRVSAIQKPQQ